MVDVERKIIQRLLKVLVIKQAGQWHE